MRPYGPYADARDALDDLERRIEQTISASFGRRRAHVGDIRSYIVSTTRRHVAWLRALRACRIQAAYGREYP